MKVLIVDDESIVRLSLRRVFEKAGFLVVEAKDGIEGLRVWEEEKPHIVLLDVLMPGLTGPNLLKERQGKRDAKVILMSAYSGEYDLNKAQALGADLFIPKPFDDIFQVVEIARGLLNE